MKKQEPEVKVSVPSVEEQLIDAREKIKTFASLRGKLGCNSLDYALRTSKSPSHFRRIWDEQIELMEDSRAVGTQMAMYKRDGWNVAFRVLYDALSNSSYNIPGEMPREQTYPCTLVILDPEKTFVLLRWLLNARYCELEEYMLRKDVPSLEVLNMEYWYPVSQYTLDLFKAFPSLEEFILEKEEDGLYKGYELCAAYRADVLRQFDDFKDFGYYTKPLSLSRLKFQDGIEEVDTLTFGFMFLWDTNKVFELFPRKDQDRLATWSFDLTKSTTLNIETIGIHPENEHERWERAVPGLMSRNVTHGYGATVNSDGLLERMGLYYSQVWNGGYPFFLRDNPQRFIMV